MPRKFEMVPETVLIKTSHDAKEMLRRLESCIAYIDSRASLSEHENTVLMDLRHAIKPARDFAKRMVKRETRLHRTESAERRNP